MTLRAPARSKHRLLPLLGLWLVAVAQFSSFVHLVVIRHERCAVHGELVERVGPTSAHAPPSVDGVAWRSLEVHDDDHDSCPQALHPGRLTLDATVLQEPVLAGRWQLRSNGTHGVILVDERLSFAPKTSPPQRA